MWLIAGLILLIAEMGTGTIFLVFIALGCFSAAATSMGLPDAVTLQILVCSCVSVLGAFGLRKPLQRRLLKKTNLQVDVGRELLIDQDIEPHKRSRISYQGTTWEASNIGSESVRQGDHVTIVGIDGNVLLIRKLD